MVWLGRETRDTTEGSTVWDESSDSMKMPQTQYEAF